MFIKLFFIALPVFVIIDMIWLEIVAENFYKKQIGFLMRPGLNLLATIIYYLIFIVGLVIFVISPAVEKQSWSYALLVGALFGLVTYANYDLLNLATVKDWPLKVTIVDITWGIILSASVSIVTYYMATRTGHYLG